MLKIVASAILRLSAGLRNERGQDLIEYAMLGGLLALALVVSSMALLSAGIADFSTGIGACIDWVPATDCSS